MQDRDDGTPFSRMPASNEVEQVARGASVDGRKGLVQQDDGSVLQDQARKQHPLELTGRQAADGTSLETLQADCTERALGLRALLARDAPKPADPVPVAEQHRLENRDRERAVDLGGLRQVGDLRRRDALKLDVPL